MAPPEADNFSQWYAKAPLHLVPRRAIGKRLVILFIENVKAQVTTRVKEADRTTLRSQLVYSTKVVIRESSQLEVLHHVSNLHRLGYRRDSPLHHPR